MTSLLEDSKSDYWNARIRYAQWSKDHNTHYKNIYEGESKSKVYVAVEALHLTHWETLVVSIASC